MSGDMDHVIPVTESPISRKFGVMEGLNGYDNHSFDTTRSRKVSTASNHIEKGPVRKKSVLHRDLENTVTAINGDVKQSWDSHRCSQSESGYSATHFSNIDDEGRSWWYIFCMKCRSHDTEKPPWQPAFWPKLCPHPFFPSYRQFTRILSLSLIGLFAWCILYAIVGDTAAPPHGKLYQLILLSISAHIGGWLMSLTTLPALIGMLFTGLLFQNVNIVNIDDTFTPITKQVSRMALVIILTRAGLDLDPTALKRLKFTVMKLSLVPWFVEAGAVAVLSRYILDLSWKFASLLGVIVAAVAPAVIVPCLFRLRAKSYGVAKGIPTLIIAVASIGDSTSVAVFGIMKGIMFSEDTSITSIVLQGPMSIIGGIGFGILWGVICGYAPERNDPYVAPLRILLLLAGGMASVFGSELLGYGGAGPLGCVTSAFVALVFWSKQGWDVEDNPAATNFEIFWMIFQPILFGVTGARVRLHELDENVVFLSIGVLILGTVIRIMATTVIGIGCRLNLKEKVFVSICWMCKAMVQAALGPVALSLVAPNTDEHDMAKKILTTSILAIMVTAPTGALLITILGPRLLTKANLPSLPEVRRRKRSHHLSIRDISIIDEDEFQSKDIKESVEDVSARV